MNNNYITFLLKEGELKYRKHRESLTGPLPAGLCPNYSFNCAKQRLPSSAFLLSLSYPLFFTEMMLVLVPELVLGRGICKHFSNISQTAYFHWIESQTVTQQSHLCLRVFQIVTFLTSNLICFIVVMPSQKAFDAMVRI